MRYYLSLMVLTLLACLSCKKQYSIIEFTRMVESDPSFFKQQIKDDIEVSSNYLPTEYMALSEIRNLKNESIQKVSQVTFKEKEKQFENSCYFRIKVSRTDNEDILQSLANGPEEYSRLLNYLTFNLNDCFYLSNGITDSVKCLNYYYQRNYGLSPDINFIISFPQFETSSSNLKLSFNPKFMGFSEPFNFFYKTKVINAVYPSFNEIN